MTKKWTQYWLSVVWRVIWLNKSMKCHNSGWTSRIQCTNDWTFLSSVPKIRLSFLIKLFNIFELIICWGVARWAVDRGKLEDCPPPLLSHHNSFFISFQYAISQFTHTWNNHYTFFFFVKHYFWNVQLYLMYIRCICAII